MVSCYYKPVAALHITDIWMLMWAAAVPGSRRGCCRCWYAVTELVMISRKSKSTCAPSLSCWAASLSFPATWSYDLPLTSVSFAGWVLGRFPWQLCSRMLEFALTMPPPFHPSRPLLALWAALVSFCSSAVAVM